ncbi:transcription initiation factor TFIIH subunit 4 [Cryptococcus deuterogattii 99/473]|uniref:RNA polymerase II transcription factor B subunit 2 n=1 Tax=Cryptococcus deuterogattii Ram5 TaxID=1296110 RepID=A0A0D0TSB5_9TREE|nr:transcription initiation factor TFIIH subunit 4 [Cryptococcus deuterogattii LA55]KIR32214.1 transcription initiation factor TFIIH subunit 4 [Cryptococcus deuterogattii MMRL2647]KIR38488.1 transcription initiation factor TFIIH subunit 4 [Cryptococcus deuterogattii Ram5]KIR70475.1 transcription initiation factor TFIIH subunit 4 [Cryptococcus deuterogattii CA1014]KIR90320.1 transcription initiation factor TFIIH subunit 4 [Cryptococcus deuterogattii CBS 10090]KIR97008.1 transcription initiation
MVQPSFSAPKKDVSKQASLTSALDIFLDNQHQSYFEELYRSEAVCLCILRLLPPVCRQIILHALWSHHPLRVTDVKLLLQMDVHAPLEDFRGASNSFGVPFERHQATDLDLPSKDELVAYGEETFESILKYMVSSGLGTEFSGSRPQPEVLQLLLASGLMTDPGDMSRRNPNIYRLTITSKGFQFLLEKRQTQLWEILMYYLSAKEVLSMFFSLGCMQLGQDYSASNSFPHAQEALNDLAQYGFIYKPSPDSDQFWPTHLATSLCSGDASAIQSQSADDKRFLILETNYKIYAYTSNELEIAILNLFVDIRIRYPNLVVGKLDRQHVKAAMEKGISARQIIAYLSSHAHPQMYNSPPPLLHPTIVDQLHLWDRERNRLQTEETVMYEFFSKELFDDTVNEAKANAALQHAATSQKLLFIEPHTKPAITEFVKQRQNVLRGGY